MSDDSARRRTGINVITEAQPSYDDEFRSRRRRYVVMMLMRIPFLVAAAALYHTPWLAILLIAVSIPLPWCAVLIANDGPARKRRKVPRGVVNDQRALAGPTQEIVDSPAGGDGVDPEGGAPAGDRADAADARQQSRR